MATYLHFEHERIGCKGWYRHNGSITLVSFRAVYLADHIFELDGETVTWAKNRRGDLTEEINSYELLKIVLSSKELPRMLSIPRKKV
jgi:hypothetical protein